MRVAPARRTMPSCARRPRAGATGRGVAPGSPSARAAPVAAAAAIASASASMSAGRAAVLAGLVVDVDLHQHVQRRRGRPGDAVASASTSRGRSTVCTQSKIVAASRALFDCRWPIRCHSMPESGQRRLLGLRLLDVVLAEGGACSSCAPATDAQACASSATAVAGWRLETANNRGAGLPASRAALSSCCRTVFRACAGTGDPVGPGGLDAGFCAYTGIQGPSIPAGIASANVTPREFVERRWSSSGEHAWISPNYWRFRSRTRHPTCTCRPACRR